MPNHVGRSRGGLARVRQSVVVVLLIAAGTLCPPATGAATGAASAMEALAGPAAPGDLEVMTFNLRYAGAGSENSWPRRRPVTRALLRAERPDLIGTQEGLAGQLADIESDLGGDYDYVGMGRDGGTRGEFMAIFYDKTRLAARTHGHFWLSDTPEVPGSNTWGGRSIRMVTWARLHDLATGKQFYAVNTHLDNASEYARQRAARLLRERLAMFDPVLPVITTGDFNIPARRGGYVYDLLADDCAGRDTWTTAGVRGPAYGTFHGYQPLVPNGARIDWILATPGVRALATLVNPHHSAAQYPSDHLPVQARLRLP